MERSHSVAIETVPERHKCPGLSSNLGGWAGPPANTCDRMKDLSSR